MYSKGCSTRSNGVAGCLRRRARRLRSGRVLAALAGRDGGAQFEEKPSLLNDALLAVSCREHGITLITKDADFKRLAFLVRGFRRT